MFSVFFSVYVPKCVSAWVYKQALTLFKTYGGGVCRLLLLCMCVLHVYSLYFRVYMYVCSYECWGHDVDITRTLIVVLVRHLSSTIYIYLWFGLHVVVAVDHIFIFSMSSFVIADLQWVCILIFATCLPFQSWAVWLSKCMLGSVSHSPHSPNTLSMSRLSQMALGHPLHSPPVSFFHRALWSLPFLSCHTPRSLPPDRMALELRAWKRPSYTTLRTNVILNLWRSTRLKRWKLWWDF